MTLEEVLYNIQSIVEFKGEIKEMSLNQLNYYLPNASLELWRKKFGYVKDAEGFETKRQISDAMKRYVYGPSAVTHGGSIPSGYAHCVALYVTGSESTNIDLVTAETYYERESNPVTQGTTTYPIAYIRSDNKIYFSPSATSGAMVYMRTPITPVLAMKKENGIMVYDSANSTELDWEEEYHWDIVRLILGYIGISVSDQFLTSYIEGKTEQQN